MPQIIDPDQLETVVEALKQGEVIGFPTETVYGLGADATNAEAVKKIFAVKNRPVSHPLIVHIASSEVMRLWVREVTDEVQKLADTFWPGPLTIILKRNGRVAGETVASKPTVGLRVPDHPAALELLETFAGGIAAPSANKFGDVSATTAAHIVDDFSEEEVPCILDGGKCVVGVESTIIDMTDIPTLLRSGGVPVESIETVLGCAVIDGTMGESRAPGMLPSHYAPRASVEVVSFEELEDISFDTEEGLGVIAPGPVDCALSWRLPNNAEGYARSLYAVFREADKRGAKKLLIVPPAEGEILAAVLDRLTKASAPRIK